MYFFYSWGGGGGACEKNQKLGGGGLQFSNFTPSNPTSPLYPIKNERSLRAKQLSMAVSARVIWLCA